MHPLFMVRVLNLKKVSLDKGSLLGIFENGLSWTLYKYMESDFIHFLEYVPYTHDHQKVYSPKLLALLLQIGGYIDTVFKEMAKFNDFRGIPECQEIISAIKKREYGIGFARTAFERIYRLSSNNGGKLEAKLSWFGPKQINPFKNFAEGKNPGWWSAYNAVKHKWSEALSQANLVNTLEALAGALLLNSVHYPSIKKIWELGDLKTVYKTAGGYKEIRIPERIFDKLLEEAIKNLNPLNYDLRLETSLFTFDSFCGSKWEHPTQ
jgi:hypothetical protein